MPSEISTSASINVSKNGATAQHAMNKVLDMDGDNLISNVQTVGTDEEVILAGDISFPCGMIYIFNLHPTDDLLISKDDAGAHLMGEIPPGGAFVSYGLPAAPYVKFATSGNIQAIITEQ
jgi:hypothetical protein